MSGYERTIDYDEVLKFIIQYKLDNDGIAPSYEEIGAGFGIRSKSHVKSIVLALVEEGKLELDPRKARSIRVTGGEWVYHG